MRFYYENVTGLNQSGLFQPGITVNAPPGGTARVIKYIYLPTSTEAGGAHIGYRYDYSAYGMMYQVTQFRGMTINTAANDYTQVGAVSAEGTTAAQTIYNYHGTPVNSATGLSDAPFYTTRTDDWAGRTSAQPVYTFSVDQPGGISTVTAPDGSITETRTIVTAGSVNEGRVKQITIKSTTVTLADTFYEWDPAPPGNKPRLTQVKTTDVMAGQTKSVLFEYDPNTVYNNLWKVSERDITTDGSVSPTELRRTETTYVTDISYLDRGLISLPSIVKVFPGHSTSPIKQVAYFYDQFGLGAAPDITMYENPAPGVRGNLTTVRTYPDISNLSNYIDHAATYDIAGNAITAQLDCCQQKSITYSGAFKHAYPTSVTTGAGPTLMTSTNYDFNNGLVYTSTDENSQTTLVSYHPDSLRPFQTDLPGGGIISYHYSDQLHTNQVGQKHYFVTITTRLDASRYVDSYSFYDGRGAVAQTFDNWTSANGWATQDIEYDVMGPYCLKIKSTPRVIRCLINKSTRNESGF